MYEAIETFLAVAAGRTVESVGIEQGITPSGVTKRVQYLEGKLNTRLFMIGRRRIPGTSSLELTPAGQAFLPYAQGAIKQLELGRAAVAQFAPAQGNDQQPARKAS